MIQLAELARSLGGQMVSTRGWVETVDLLYQDGYDDEQIIGCMLDCIAQPAEFEKLQRYGLKHLRKFWGRITLVRRDAQILADIQDTSARSTEKSALEWRKMWKAYNSDPMLKDKALKLLRYAGCPDDLLATLGAEKPPIHPSAAALPDGPGQAD